MFNPNFITQNPVAFSLEGFYLQLLSVIPTILVALIIWLIGDYLIGLGVRLLRKIDIKGTNLDDRLIGVLTTILSTVGKAVLFLVILDYLGIGRTLIGALMQGLTLTVAIALGLSFGKALEGDAKNLVDSFKKKFLK